MGQDLLHQNINRKFSKGFIITIILIIIVILGWAGLTKAGYIENYLAIELLNATNPSNYEDHIFGKPVIYLYPKQEQIINVKLTYFSNLLVSYPEYNNGWSVLAYPDGKIINQADNKEYSYLFWEGMNKNAKYDLGSGFIIKGSETIKFLQDKLSYLGLSPKEYNEFIVYWLPQMQNHKFNLIHFATKEEYDDKAVLDIRPKPDSMLRVFMVFKELKEDNILVKQQNLKPFKRNGFSVIEWGGTEIK